MQKLRTWAAQIGELRLSDDERNPIATIQLTGIDTAQILERARYNDTTAERRRMIRQMLIAAFGIPPQPGGETFWLSHPFLWRGTQRRVELVFDNVRDQARLPDDALRPNGSDPKIVVDLPFDEAAFGPSDDRVRVHDFLQRHAPAETVCWLPNFLTQQLQNDLGTLVILDYILTGDRLGSYTDHLSVSERPAARQILENQLSALRQAVTTALAQAYAATTATSAMVTTTLDPSDQFLSLDPAFHPAPPVGPTLSQALAGLCDQLYSYRYPDHPEFLVPIKDADLRTVLAECTRAADAPDDNYRIEVDSPNRKCLTNIAQPLGLGTQYETAFLLSHEWKERFEQAHAAAGGGAMTVERLREFTDRPKPAGLEPRVQDLVILVYAALARRSFWRAGTPASDVGIGKLANDLELREQELPSAAAWAIATTRAEAIFGISGVRPLTAGETARLAGEIEGAVMDVLATARAALERVGRLLDEFSIERGRSARYRALATGEHLLTRLADAAPNERVSALAEADLGDVAPATIRANLTAGPGLLQADAHTAWPVLASAAALAPNLPAAVVLMAALNDVLLHDELGKPFAPAIAALQEQALAIAMPKAVEPIVVAPTPLPGLTRIDGGSVEQAGREKAEAELARITTILEQDAAYRLTIEWTVERDDSAS